MTDQVAWDLRTHLLRGDGQEDVTLATYSPSTGVDRRTALVRAVHLPRSGEREVHGNASFTGNYVVRVAAAAAHGQAGVVILHSHPGAMGWQGMSGPDADAERSYAYLVHEITGLPLLGMTLAGGDGGWSARIWEPGGQAIWCESVRVIDDVLHVSWNEALRPTPRVCESQVRTVSAWGPRTQADIARLRVLVVGAGSVGLEVALRLVASGVEHVGVMDFDSVEFLNLDRLIGATRLDAFMRTPKVEVARRLMQRAATAEHPLILTHEVSICEPAGRSLALDYDVVFSCVDRPWPRAVLNMLAYADLIPVIDGGLHIDPFPDDGMRNATWRSHVIRPGRPCLACNHQLDLGLVSVDREGLLDDPEYIRRAGGSVGPARQNVAMLSVSVVSSLLAQFVSLTTGPGGLGDPGPLQYVLSTHSLVHRPYESNPNCYFERSVATGDQRLDLTGVHAAAEAERARRRRLLPGTRVLRLVSALVGRASSALEQYAGRRLNP
jgi:hypothetical protein